MTTEVTRREARERAIELAYEAEQRDSEIDSLIKSLDIEPSQFTIDLLNDMEKYQAEADSLIETKATGWDLNRMPLIDVLIMRLAVSEFFVAQVPVGAVISEAVDLAKQYSTDDSPKFVNGILSAISEELASREE